MEASKKKDQKICDVSDVMGSFGKYEIIQYILTCLPLVFISMISINYVFAVGNVNYRCRVEKCEDANSTVQFPNWWPDKGIDRCSTPVLRSGEAFCTNNSFTGALDKCKYWIYENNNSVVTELDLACQPWKTNLVGTIHCVGMLLSLLVYGWISDTFGRKPTIIFSIVTGSIGVTKTLATTYHIYVIVELIEAIVTGGFHAAGMVLLIEIAGKKYRLLAGISWACAIYLGEFLLACIAMFVPYWKTYVYIIYSPCICFIFLIFFINESPRWQIVVGRGEKAKQTLKKIADVNKINIDFEKLEKLDQNTLRERFDIKNNEFKENLIHAVKSKEIVKRFVVAGMNRFTSSIIYNSLIVNAVVLPGNKYINFILTTLMSFPGELLALYLMNKIGRKMSLITCFSICGTLFFISAFIPTRLVYVKLALFLCSKMIISACLSGAITYSMELFPTSVRASLVGLTAICSRTGAMLAPLTPILNTVSDVLLYSIFGCCSIFCALILFLTPETKDLPLFDTISQVENYGSDRATHQQE